LGLRASFISAGIFRPVRFAFDIAAEPSRLEDLTNFDMNFAGLDVDQQPLKCWSVEHLGRLAGGLHYARAGGRP